MSDNRKTEEERRHKNLMKLMDDLIVNDEPDLVDNTGVMNYLHLTHAKPAEDETNNYIVNSDAFTHI